MANSGTGSDPTSGNAPDDPTSFSVGFFSEDSNWLGVPIVKTAEGVPISTLGGIVAVKQSGEATGRTSLIGLTCAAPLGFRDGQGRDHVLSYKYPKWFRMPESQSWAKRYVPPPANDRKDDGDGENQEDDDDDDDDDSLLLFNDPLVRLPPLDPPVEKAIVALNPTKGVVDFDVGTGLDWALLEMLPLPTRPELPVNEYQWHGQRHVVDRVVLEPTSEKVIVLSQSRGPIGAKLWKGCAGWINPLVGHHVAYFVALEAPLYPRDIGCWIVTEDHALLAVNVGNSYGDSKHTWLNAVPAWGVVVTALPALRRAGVHLDPGIDDAIKSEVLKIPLGATPAASST